MEGRRETGKKGRVTRLGDELIPLLLFVSTLLFVPLLFLSFIAGKAHRGIEGVIAVFTAWV